MWPESTSLYTVYLSKCITVLHRVSYLDNNFCLCKIYRLRAKYEDLSITDPVNVVKHKTHDVFLHCVEDTSCVGIVPDPLCVF